MCRIDDMENEIKNLTAKCEVLKAAHNMLGLENDKLHKFLCSIKEDIKEDIKRMDDTLQKLAIQEEDEDDRSEDEYEEDEPMQDAVKIALAQLIYKVIMESGIKIEKAGK